MSKLTPMMRQYLEIKDQYPDAILFFRLGDFYEMFLDDAITAARVLDITLTSRNKGAADEVPLCGIPYHSCRPYIAKLVENGYKVAICEQIEDPKDVKGIVKRAVVRVVTPGLIVDENSLQPKRNNYLVVINDHRHQWGIASVDITTGEFRIAEISSLEALGNEIAGLDPREIVLNGADDEAALPEQLVELCRDRTVTRLPSWVFARDRAESLLREFYRCDTLDAFGCNDLPAATGAAGAALHYLQETQRGMLNHLRSPSTYAPGDFMMLDDTTRRNLELTVTLHDGRKAGSLLGVLDRTVTAMGGRKLRHWLQQPLISLPAIVARHEAVAELVDESLLRDDLRTALDGVYDLERLNSRIAMATGNARDLVALRVSLERLPDVIDALGHCQAPLLQSLRGAIDPLQDLAALIERSIVAEPPVSLRDGGLIQPGYNRELDELRTISREGKGWIARLERDERERTGISNLKVKFNKVFGYFIEVTRSHLEQVPDDFMRKQTLANAERFITPALKEYEEKVLGAEERIVDIEYQLFQALRTELAGHGQRLQTTAEALASIDVIAGLADLAHQRDYVRPQMTTDTTLMISEGRHPVIEAMTLSEPFVPNDVLMDAAEEQLLIVTGPNMAGKSTFMRQVALIALMAQMGSLVPAHSARIGIIDRIFTRVGASDNLSRGQSTFMVEMTETANILNHATWRSLIILDEIGRGTSTFDGLSIAWAVAEYLHDYAPCAARTLFATHYHELTELATTRERVRNYNVAVKEWNDRIIFLRKIVRGGASHSYGIQVARLAGLPHEIIDRAKEILKNLESGEYLGEGQPRLARSTHDTPMQNPQLALFDQLADPLRERLRTVDPASTTPLEALNLLAEIQELI
ncbi:MAG: DNA mismatch repair protein MutS [Desulfuromonadales bacterium]|nr:DNA mismatch repair protein MutS [Desulfuromonadales bacterium]